MPVRPDPGAALPRLSVIIPTYNRADRVLACVEALCAQTSPPDDFEVIVVIDGSTDRTAEVLSRVRAPFHLRVLWQENRGWSAALNRGAAAAEGHVCLFVDDDIVPDPSLVEEHLRAHGREDGIVGIGQMTLRIPEQADWFVERYVESWSGHYARLNDGRPPFWADCYGGNLSVPRASVLEVGGLPLDLARGRDIEFGYRLQRAGLRFVYLPKALGHQDERKTFGELATDAEKAGGAWVEIYRRHPPVLPDLLGSYHHTRLLARVLQYVGLSLRLRPRFMRSLVQLVGKRDYRAFHFLRNYCYWRGVKRAADRDLWRRLTSGTRILMYHAFGRPGERAGPYVLPARRFVRHIAWLRRLGFRFIALDEYLACRRDHRLPPARSIVLTIDDGYRDARTLAQPILGRYQVPATLFVVSGEVGGRNGWSKDRQLAGRPLVSWADLADLIADGVSVGAHTESHPDLTRLSDEEAMAEMAGSRAALEQRLGIGIRAFAYPYGEVDGRIQDLAARVGFECSCGIRAGINTVHTPIHALERLEIFGTDSAAMVVVKAWLGRTHIGVPRPGHSSSP